MGPAGLAKGLGQPEQRVQVVRRQAEGRRELFQRLDRQVGVLVERSQRQVRLPVGRIQLRGTGDLFRRLVVLTHAPVGLAQAKTQEGTVRRSGHAVFVHLEPSSAFSWLSSKSAQLQIGAGIGRVDSRWLAGSWRRPDPCRQPPPARCLVLSALRPLSCLSSGLQRLIKCGCGLVRAPWSRSPPACGSRRRRERAAWTRRWGDECDCQPCPSPSTSPSSAPDRPD